MKKLIIIAAIILLAVPAMAADKTQNLTFEWQQASADLASLDKWVLHIKGASGGSDLSVLNVPYVSGAGPVFTSTSPFTVSGTPGAMVRRYFTLTAHSKNGQASGPSNEVSFDFQIPFADVTVPLQLKVTVTVTP